MQYRAIGRTPAQATNPFTAKSQENSHAANHSTIADGSGLSSATWVVRSKVSHLLEGRGWLEIKGSERGTNHCNQAPSERVELQNWCPSSSLYAKTRCCWGWLGLHGSGKLGGQSSTPASDGGDHTLPLIWATTRRLSRHLEDWRK